MPQYKIEFLVINLRIQNQRSVSDELILKNIVIDELPVQDLLQKVGIHVPNFNFKFFQNLYFISLLE